MPFKSAAARRAGDVATLTHDDCPLGLDEGESVTYWTRLPHSAQARVLSASLRLILDKRGRTASSNIDLGEYALTTIAAGIVDWTLFDEKHQAVHWDPSQARVLMDGLHREVTKALGDKIKSDDPPVLNAVDPETAVDGEGPTVGETSADR